MLRLYLYKGRTGIEDFERLFRNHRQSVFNLLLRMTGNYDLALDLTQEVFLNALRGWAGLRDRSQGKVWLFRIAKNVALRNMERNRCSSVPLDAVAEGLESREPRPDAGLLRKEQESAVQTALGSLPAEMRLVLLLKHSEDLDYREIAEILGCSEGTVASRLSRARRLLGRKMETLR